MIVVTSGTNAPTFTYRYPATHECGFVPLWCPNDKYQGGQCEGHVAGYACVEDEDCDNAMVMLPDWGGPCPDAMKAKQEER